MIKVRTLFTLLAIAWLLLVCCQPLFYQARWPECGQLADLLARWSYTHYWRLGMAAVLLWHLLGGLAGGK